MRNSKQRFVQRGWLCFLFLSFSLVAWAEPSHKVLEDQAKLPLLNPTLASRVNRKIVLPNGLKADLISDPSIDHSGAALIVSVGSQNDPKEYPGMAHFLEHMLFLGTEKYPAESDFDHMVSQYGGVTNAFTTQTSTSFIFEIPHKGFEEALDRFSQFFQKPLFNPSGVERELEAINQEFSKNTQNDGIKWYYTIKALSDPSNPFQHFGMGNKQTLTKVSQERLKEWYLNHYSADKMQLVVYSNLSEDRLVDLVVKAFSSIPQRKVEDDPSQHVIFPQSEKMVFIEPIQNIKQLSLSWIIPKELSSRFLPIEVQPWELVSYVIGDEGKGTLFDVLKQRGFAEKLSCGSFAVSSKERLFVIDVDLTTLGLSKIDEVSSLCFSMIRFLQENPFPKQLFDEIQTLQKLQYQYKFQDQLFTLLSQDAQMLAEETIDTFPQYSQVIQTFDPEAVHRLVESLTENSCHIALMAKRKEAKVDFSLLEPMLQTRYAVKEIPKSFFKSMNVSLHYPPKNPYVATNLEVLFTGELDRRFPTPKRLLKTDQAEIYYAPDAAFHLPQSAYLLTLRTPEIDLADARKACLAELFTSVINECLKEKTYPAKLAGLEYVLKTEFNGLFLECFGFSEKLPLLFKTVLHKLKHPTCQEQLFLEKKEALLRK